MGIINKYLQIEFDAVNHSPISWLFVRILVSIIEEKRKFKLVLKELSSLWLSVSFRMNLIKNLTISVLWSSLLYMNHVPNCNLSFLNMEPLIYSSISERRVDFKVSSISSIIPMNLISKFLSYLYGHSSLERVAICLSQYYNSVRSWSN